MNTVRVQRYSLYFCGTCGCFCELESDSTGDLVYYDDYAKLEAENAALKQQLAVIAEYFDGYRGHIPPNVRAAALSKENSDG